MGIDPRPFTLRQLLLMAEGRDRQLWTQTANLASLIANVSGNLPKGKTITPDELNPYAIEERRQRQADVDPAMSWRMMEALFNPNYRKKK